jgi:RNA polymerase sigma factor (sigma-70 family)
MDMANAQTGPVGHLIRRLSAAHLAAVATDGELVQRFTARGEEAAFAALVRRHGPLVLGVCRRVLNDAHAAEDCFQVTFLVLARKAGSLTSPQSLGPWLHGVAMRTALKARAREARRRACERRAAAAEAVAPCDGPAWRDLRLKLDAAIAALPDKHRTPFVLHHLQGLTVAEVAGRLGCPPGTAAARLARAKEQLRARLARQGLAWGMGALTLAVVPPALAAGTVQAAIGVAATEAAGGLTAMVAALMTGGLRVMFASKAKVALAVLLTASALGVGVGVRGRAGQGGAHPGDGRATVPGARQAIGGRRPGGDALALGRYYAGGLRTVRGFELNVQERPTGSLMFGVGVNSDAGLAGSIVLNERNFDILRQPTSPDDFADGAAWRGAGQEMRIEAVPGTQVQRCTVSHR